MNVSDNCDVNQANNCDRLCSNCKTTITPLWRKFGPVKFLCNACGLYYKVNGDHRPYYMSKNQLNSLSKKLLLRCSNCGTSKTTMWRKSGEMHVCNACGLYYRINGHNRPVTMRKDVIRTRRRRDNSMYEIPFDTIYESSKEKILPDIKVESIDIVPDYQRHPAPSEIDSVLHPGYSFEMFSQNHCTDQSATYSYSNQIASNIILPNQSQLIPTESINCSNYYGSF